MSAPVEVLEEQLRHQRAVADSLDRRARAATKEHKEAVIAVQELEQRLQVKRDQAVEVVTVGELRGLRAIRDVARAFVERRSFDNVAAMSDAEVAELIDARLDRMP